MRIVRGIGAGLRGIFAVALAVLLALQVAMAYQPGANPPVPGPNEALIELCDGTGLRTIVIDLISGAVREADPESGSGAPKCPFCLVGVGLVATAQPLPGFARVLHDLELPPPAARVLVAVRRDDSRSIRGPPVSV